MRHGDAVWRYHQITAQNAFDCRINDPWISWYFEVADFIFSEYLIVAEAPDIPSIMIFHRSSLFDTATELNFSTLFSRLVRLRRTLEIESCFIYGDCMLR